MKRRFLVVHSIKFETDADRINHLQSLKNIPSINPKNYDSTAEYYRLDFIHHPEFGFGFVEEVLSDKEVKVYFSGGERILSQRSYLRKKVI